jgi:D-psicose/D-tagatose/L-ribulose 3-epimerase
MKVGMNLLLWTDDAGDPCLEALLPELAGLGYDGVEVPIFTLDPEPYVRLGARIQDLGMEALALTARGPEANPIARDRVVRARGVQDNLAAVECAAALGAELLSGPFLAAPCQFSGAPPTDEERGWAVAALREMAEAADGHGITLAVESLNHFEHHLANTAAQTAELVRAADHPRARMMYDTFHAHIEEKDVRAAIHGCADVLVYVHLSENDRATPGSGQVDWAATFETLAEIGYDGWLTVEALGDEHPRLAADMRIWRHAYGTRDELVRDGLAFTRTRWATAQASATAAMVRSSRGMSGPAGA